MNGTIKFFNRLKGFGFITPENSNSKDDVFVHRTGCQGQYVPQDGDQVTFETENGKKGINAVNVQLAK